MDTLSALPALTSAQLTTEQILERMPNSSANELQCIHRQLQTTCQGLQQLSNGQLFRLLDDKTRSSINRALECLKESMPPLAQAISSREAAETQQVKIQQALIQAFPALALVNTDKPNNQALLQVVRWMLIAETDLYFSWLLTPSGNLEFFEQEQSRLLRFLTQCVLERLEQNNDYPFIQVMESSVKKLREMLSRTLNKTETASFKRIQEELSVELSANVVRLNPKGKSTQQGEYA